MLGKGAGNTLRGLCFILLLLLSAVVSDPLCALFYSKLPPAFRTADKSGGGYVIYFPDRTKKTEPTDK